MRELDIDIDGVFAVTSMTTEKPCSNQYDHYSEASRSCGVTDIRYKVLVYCNYTHSLGCAQAHGSSRREE